MESTIKHFQPTDCFLTNKLQVGQVPIYDVDEGTHIVAWQDGQAHDLYEPGKRNFPIPFSIVENEEEVAWNVLVAASFFTPPVPVSKLRDHFAKHDLAMSGIVQRNGITMAVAGAEFLGIRPKDACGVGQGFAVHNPLAVVRVCGSDDELEALTQKS